MSFVVPFYERLNNRLFVHGEAGWKSELEAVLGELDLENRDFSAHLNKPIKDFYDVIVIGSGPGGGTVAHALAATGKSILLIERGGFLPQEPNNWNSSAVLGQQIYSNSEEWLDSDGVPFQPNMYYYVGGMTKLYAATLLRYRTQDFQSSQREDGISPAWPITYEEVEPWYAEAERLYMAHGSSGDDPTEPPRSGPFPYPPPAVPEEVLQLKNAFAAAGMHPYSIPGALSLFSGGRCMYCAWCDSHPCRVLARGDAELCCVRPAVRAGQVTLVTNCKATRLNTTPNGKEITSVEVDWNGATHTFRAGTFIVSCGAVNSPALLLRSRTDAHPNGLANSSGLVGRRYMRHLSTVILAQVPKKKKVPKNHYWKTVGFNDFYLKGTEGWPYPLGTAQIPGNYHECMDLFLPPDTPGSPAEKKALAAQMMPVFLFSEDLGVWENRVALQSDDRIQLTYRPNCVESHKRLIREVTAMLKKAGYGTTTSISFTEVKNGGGYHHGGTVCFGDDPATSVLDRNCKAHDLENLYVVDTCFMPSLPALNPVLSIVANALRVSDHLRSVI